MSCRHRLVYNPRMKTSLRRALLVVGLAVTVSAAQSAPSVLTAVEAKKLIPQNYFYAGQTAPVQVRNSAVAKSGDGKFVLAALGDNSGYSSAIAEKYQGLFEADGAIEVGGKPLGPGAYGIGTVANGDFVVTDLSGKVLFTVPTKNDAEMKRPVPLKMTVNGEVVRLYLGRKYVEIKFAANS